MPATLIDRPLSGLVFLAFPRDGGSLGLARDRPLGLGRFIGCFLYDFRRRDGRIGSFCHPPRGRRLTRRLFGRRFRGQFGRSAFRCRFFAVGFFAAVGALGEIAFKRAFCVVAGLDLAAGFAGAAAFFAAGFAAIFFATGFLAAIFFATGFSTAAFLLAPFLVVAFSAGADLGAAAFAAGFFTPLDLAPTFFASTFRAADFFPVSVFFAADFRGSDFAVSFLASDFFAFARSAGTSFSTTGFFAAVLVADLAFIFLAAARAFLSSAGGASVVADSAFALLVASSPSVLPQLIFSSSLLAPFHPPCARMFNAG